MGLAGFDDMMLCLRLMPHLTYSYALSFSILSAFVGPTLGRVADCVCIPACTREFEGETYFTPCVK
jgi:hypothetical protein